MHLRWLRRRRRHIDREGAGDIRIRRGCCLHRQAAAGFGVEQRDREDRVGLAAGGAGLCVSTMLRSLLAAEGKPRFRISACDWSIGCAGDIRAFEVAKTLGLDGVEASFGGPDGKFDLRKEEVRKQYHKAATENGV